MIILRNALPRIKGFVKPTGWDEQTRSFAVRMLAAFLIRCGRMSASEAAQSSNNSSIAILMGTFCAMIITPGLFCLTMKSAK